MHYRKSFMSYFLMLLHFLLGVGAIGGGVVFIIDPSGGMMGLSPAVLERSPFSDFLIPGIILTVMFGIIPLMVCASLFKPWRFYTANLLNIYRESHWAWTYSLYIGFALIIWIMIQTYILSTVELIHLVFMSIGLLIQVVTLLPSVRRNYTDIRY